MIPRLIRSATYATHTHTHTHLHCLAVAPALVYPGSSALCALLRRSFWRLLCTQAWGRGVLRSANKAVLRDRVAPLLCLC
jgi:hypothetical protein